MRQVLNFILLNKKNNSFCSGTELGTVRQPWNCIGIGTTLHTSL